MDEIDILNLNIGDEISIDTGDCINSCIASISDLSKVEGVICTSKINLVSGDILEVHAFGESPFFASLTFLDIDGYVHYSVIAKINGIERDAYQIYSAIVRFNNMRS